MAWIPLRDRSTGLQASLDRLQKELGWKISVDDYYNQQEYGLLTEQQLVERISRLQPVTDIPEVAAGDPQSPSPQIREGKAFEQKSLRYLRNNADCADDRRWAEALHDSMLLELWLQHVTETGDTYYPPLADDLFDSYQLLEGGHHN